MLVCKLLCVQKALKVSEHTYLFAIRAGALKDIQSLWLIIFIERERRRVTLVSVMCFE